MTTAPGTLGEHQGHDIIATRIEIPGVSGGLNKGLAVKPQMLPIGTRFTIALDCVVVKDKHEPIPDSDTLTYVAVCKADVGTIVERGMVAKALEAQKALINQSLGHAPLVDGDGKVTKAAKAAKPGGRAIGDLGPKPAPRKPRAPRQGGEPAKVGAAAKKVAGAAKKAAKSARHLESV